MNHDVLTDYAALSQTVGVNPAYVQGGGGNTSAKLDNNTMAVKASGFLLSDVTTQKGYTEVNYKGIKDSIIQGILDDQAYTTTINNSLTGSQQRPSIETGFHAILGKYVIHTHSVYANVLTCSKQGKDIVNELFADALWVPYATPGKDLTLAIWQMLSPLETLPNIIFLENHGLIVSASESQIALNLHEQVNLDILNKLSLNANFDENAVVQDMQFLKQHVLFPDQVVYTLSDDTLLQTTAAQQTLAAYHYIITNIEHLQFTPRFLSPQHVNILTQMESEKYRQQVIKT